MNLEQPVSRMETSNNAGAGIAGAAAHSASRLLARRVPVRGAWIGLAALGLSLFVAGLPVRYELLLQPPASVRGALAQLGLTTVFYATYIVSLEIVVAVAFLTIAGVIFWRKPGDKAALFVSLMLMLFGLASYPILPTMNALSGAVPALMPLVRLMTYLTWVLVFLFFCVFPDGHFTARWTGVLALFATLISIPWNLWPDSPYSPWQWPPILFVAFEITLWGACIYAQVDRYRHYSGPVQRQQTKWAVFGMTTAAGGVLFIYLLRVLFPTLEQPGVPGLLYQILGQTGMYLLVLLLPVTMSFSILRYKLWDVDLVINRTLVYVPLTGILTGLYAASIALFQRVFITATGEKSDTAIVLSTLVLASAFTPVKNALQAAVDRRFKETPDPTRGLQDFNREIEAIVDVIDPHEVTHRLLDRAIEAYGVEGGAVYLGSGRDLQLLCSTENWDDKAALVLPLKSNGIQMGLLKLGPRNDGSPYAPADRELLRKVARLVATDMALNERLQ